MNIRAWALAAVFLSSASVEAKLLKSFSFDTGVLHTEQDGHFYIDDPAVDGSYTENGVSCTLVNKGWALRGTPLEKRVWLSTTITQSGSGKAIVYETGPTQGTTPDGGTMDKIQHNLLNPGEHFTRGNLYYVGFSVYVGPRSEGMEPFPSGEEQNEFSNTKDAIIYQQWQGSPYHPPFAIKVSGENPDRMTFDFFYRDNATFRQFPTKSNNLLTRIPLQKGKWYRFVIASRQCEQDAPRGCSVLKGWLVSENSQTTQLFYLRHPWGYYGVPDPSLGQKLGGKYYSRPASDKFQILVGIYRPRQNRILRIAYDDIRIGTSLAEVLK